MKKIVVLGIVLSLAVGASRGGAEQPDGTWPIILPAGSATHTVIDPVYSPPSTVLILPPPPVAPPQSSRAPMVMYKPLVPASPVAPPYYLGRGLLGQPKLYVPKQPIRNFLRYLSL